MHEIERSSPQSCPLKSVLVAALFLVAVEAMADTSVISISTKYVTTSVVFKGEDERMMSRLGAAKWLIYFGKRRYPPSMDKNAWHTFKSLP
jgi:hypothetical protein